MTSEKQRRSGAKAKRKILPPAPIIILYLIARLSSSAFVASAQYVRRQGDHRGPGLPERDWGQVSARRDQSSTSRELSINGYNDFCLFGPPDPFNFIWSSGRDVVSWCAKDGHGTRLIPDGTLHGVTYVKTKDYVQVSGWGDFTKINIAPGDVGGQFDSTANKPDGASVMIDGQAASSWVTLISSDTFCLRACTGDAAYCPSQYDQMGCWFLTGNAVGQSGTWQDCEADSGDPPGVAGGNTYDQNDPSIPQPTAPVLRDCKAGEPVSNGQGPPPLHDWDGTPAPNDAPGTASEGAANNSSEVGEGAKQSSTTWIPVETCVPCQDPVSVPSASSDTIASQTTEQVGVTQLSKNVAAAAIPPSSVSAAASKTSAAANDLNRRTATSSRDEFERRDNVETVTKNGQCCHTTYTPSVVGGTSASHKTSVGSKNASASLSGTLHVNGQGQTVVSSPGISSGAVKPSGSLSAGGGFNRSTNATGNITGNSTGNNSAGSWRSDILGVAGYGRVVLSMTAAICLGAAVGGWSLI